MNTLRVTIGVVVETIIIILSILLGSLLLYVAGRIGLKPTFVLTSVVFIIVLLVWLWVTKRFLVSSFRKIPEDPPHKGILVFLGKRYEVVLNEGWHFFPLFPILFDYVLINITKKNQDIVGLAVRTPDTADLVFDIGLTWTPGSMGNDAKLLLTYLNSGGEAGVKRIIEDIIKDRLRIWAFSSEEGPANWQEATGAKDEAIARLIKDILGEDIPGIPSDIPTDVLLRYFNEPPKPPLELQKRWGKKTEPNGGMWEGLENELNVLSQEERDELKEAIEERRNIVAAVRGANGTFVKKFLGITINRLTITNVLLTGKMAEAVERRTTEVEEAKAELTEVDGFIKRYQTLRAQNIPSPKAIELALIEQEKLVKTTHETQLGLSTDLKAVSSQLLGLFRGMAGQKKTRTKKKTSSPPAP